MQVGKRKTSELADLDGHFASIISGLQRDLTRLNDEIDEYRIAYQQHAEAREADDPKHLERLRENLRRLQQLSLVQKHVASSVAYLYDSGEPLQEHDEIRELAASILDALESERQRLYRDVHDGPAQSLTNAIYEIEFFERIVDRAPADIRAQLLSELASLKTNLRESLDDVRAMIFELRPPALSELGLAEAMRAYAAEFQSRFGLTLLTDLRVGPTGLTSAQELAIYRVFQEALQNVHKHSRARTVRIKWERGGGRWILSVIDDGVGFDLARTSRTRSVGLLTMRERAEVIGATLEVRSMPGSGTAVTLSLPMAS